MNDKLLRVHLFPINFYNVPDKLFRLCKIPIRYLTRQIYGKFGGNTAAVLCEVCVRKVSLTK